MPKQKDEIIPTRVTLMARLKDWQDQSAWQEFFDTYWNLIYGVARKSGLTDAESQDVVLDTMASVARHMPTFKYDAARGLFKAWMLNKTRWLIIDHFRKRDLLLADRAPGTRTSRTGTIDKVMDTKIKSVTEVFENEWETNVLHAALLRVKQRLDPQKYQIFDLYVNKEWPPEKVAAKFDVAVGQVYTVKARTTKMIQDEVKRLQQEAT